mgnify:CR=1 FL=1
MKEEIRRRINELWENAEEELMGLEETVTILKEYIEKRSLYQAWMEASFAMTHLKGIDDSLGDIVLLNKLLKDENEGGD